MREGCADDRSNGEVATSNDASRQTVSKWQVGFSGIGCGVERCATVRGQSLDG
ncbi:hypothetical protein [Polyangium sp. 15x6]|uniref:hypothetical protein n=1 Tax=Polyangium sp. 15x6 TaxID=3042687 RepID=UPI00249A742B|nr:hypothetical protein [Polyangium sp. 15x6]MDI3282266.1 hypothetical protein [Polyangium sp. 15x6]